MKRKEKKMAAAQEKSGMQEILESGQAPGAIIKSGTKDYRNFYHPVLDKGAHKPAFLYHGNVDDLKEEIRKGERALDMGFITPERKLTFKANVDKRKARLREIEDHGKEVRKAVQQNKDYWAKRYNELGEEIANRTPSKTAVRERRVNPHTRLKDEKGLGPRTPGRPKRPLHDVKREYQVVGGILGEETNVGFLQKE